VLNVSLNPRSLPSDLKSIVPLDKIVSGGPTKDGIASLDTPKFIKASDATFLSDNEVVIGIQHNGISKAYPLMILVWHEIVNDWFDDSPLVITYCPLCYSTIAFIRKVENEVVEFGTSGRLYKNDLVMYDRQSGNNMLIVLGSDLTNVGNLWSQFLGQAIVGDLAGYTLTQVPNDVMQWSDWKRLHPDTMVLSTDTGYPRAYGTDPYAGYYRSDSTYFPVENEDNRLPKKEIIFGIEINETYKAYPVTVLEERVVVNDVVQNVGIALFRVANLAFRAFESDVNGQRLTFEFKEGQFLDKETHSVWNEYGESIDGNLKGATMNRVQAHKAFWFAWADFHANTEVFQ
jgi:hypothetical protein